MESGSSTRRHSTPKRSLLALILLAAVITTACGSTAATSTPKPPPTRKIAAATYFGDSWPVGFWASDLSYATADFQQIKANGFNSVVLVVPWGYFQPALKVNSFNAAAFTRLDSVIEAAKQAGLGVLLRISYEWDMYPNDQQPGNARFTGVFTSSSTYAAWKSYIGELHNNVKKYSNVWGAYISWEDFQSIILDAKSADSLSSRLQLSHSTGFSQWLSRSYKLKSISSQYHAHFQSWSDVPTPLSTTPEFRLFYAFWDYQLMHRIFAPALSLYPGLTMETRVDEDPLFNGSKQIGAYSHSSTYSLPGTNVTGIYFNPYMGAEGGRIETVDQTLQGMTSVLKRVQSASGNRKLLIYEFQLYDNTPANSSNAHLSLASVPAFVTAATPTVVHKTTGYAIWTYRDYNANIVYNPDFALGLDSWTTTGNVTTTTNTEGHSVAQLAGSSSVLQAIPLGTNSDPNGANTVTVSFTATALSGRSLLRVQVGQYCSRTVVAAAAGSPIHFVCPMDASANYNLSIAATAPVQLTGIQVFSYTQLGDVYSNTGVPEPALQSLKSLNAAMLGS